MPIENVVITLDPEVLHHLANIHDAIFEVAVQLHDMCDELRRLNELPKNVEL